MARRRTRCRAATGQGEGVSMAKREDVAAYLLVAQGLAEGSGVAHFVATIGTGYAIFTGLGPTAREQGVYPSTAYRWWRVYPGGRVEEKPGRTKRAATGQEEGA